MKITILGSTGSIGKQSIDVAKHMGYSVPVITVGKNIKLAEEQIRDIKPQICAVADEGAAKLLRIAVADTSTDVISGSEGIIEAAGYLDSDVIINSIVGMAGLLPTLSALKTGSRLALANKETLVCAGDIVMNEVKSRKVELIPVDSEHSAIFRCLVGNKKYKKLILTASGGPFFGKSSDELENVTIDKVLSHPTWSMGAKITVDSATLMNKGFEVIEACHLYDCTPQRVDVVVHRESIIHSMVQFEDNSYLAQLSQPDMRECIQYALTYPDILRSELDELDFSSHGKLTFYKPDNKAFPLLSFAEKMFEKGGIYPSAMNGANEEAVAIFLEGKISFSDISRSVMFVTEGMPDIKSPSLDDIISAGNEARMRVREYFAG